MEGRPLFLFPTEAEAAPFRTLRPDAAVAIIGVGMAEAAAGTAVQMVMNDPTRVVLCGIAGACDNRLSMGQVVEVVRDRVEGLPDAYAFEYECDPVTGLEQARTLTVSRSGDAMRNVTVVEGDMPVVEQMEGAAVAAVLTNLDYENFIHIRAISNRVGEPFEQWRVGEAVAALAAVASQLFTE
jgi:nucleoside phosphorylase